MEFSVSADTAELAGFRNNVRRWLDEHVPVVPGHPDTPENYARFRKFGLELGARGWLYPMAPQRYGGGGMDLAHALVLTEEIEARDLDNPPYYDSGGRLGGASILVWGTEEQRCRFLPPIFRGEVVTWQLLSEPGAGSDIAGTATSAVRDGDHYVLKGEKVFVGGSHQADFFWVLTRTDPHGRRHANLSWFMVDARTPGITCQPMDLLGDNGRTPGHSHKNTIFLDGVRVPAANLVGGENNGWAVAETHLDFEHGTSGRAGLGRWLSRALDWAAARQSRGLPLAAAPAARRTLTEIFVLTEVERLLSTRNAWLAANGRPMTYEGPQGYYIRKQSGLLLAQALHDLFGPYALIDDPEWDFSDGTLEAFMRSAIVALHPGGTADIQKLVMARRIGVGVPSEAMARR